MDYTNASLGLQRTLILEPELEKLPDGERYYSLHTDGGSRSNPGMSAIGGILSDSNSDIILEFSVFIGIATNNQAEYLALINGLLLASRRSVRLLKCYLDSELVVKQLNGQYKLKNEDLKPLFNKVLELKKSYTEVTFNYIPREDNKTADKLVNNALDNI